MKIDVRRIGSIPVIVPTGRVTIGESSYALRTALEEAIDGGATHLIVDASRVEYLDSSGIGELLAAARRLSGTGGRLGISTPSPKVREIMEITGLHALFVVRDNEKDILVDFSPDPSSSSL